MYGVHPAPVKTATLGYIVANLLNQDKRVLFVSNTNRAVDVGLLSVIDALYEIHPGFDLQKQHGLVRLPWMMPARRHII
ncbi:MAG: hypothetical protein U5K71_13220 [Gracilimonas sp.]|nr:hypothetical protein [Gracilimonas sp.]